MGFLSWVVGEEVGGEKINHQRHFSTGSERGHRPSKTSKDYVIFLDLKFDFFKKKKKGK